MNKIMVIMRGLPGSGKSTLTEKIVQNFQTEAKLNGQSSVNFVVLSTDEVISANGHYLWNPDIGFHSHKTNQIKCKEACRRGIELVVIDNTNTTWKEIEPYVEIAAEFGYQVDIRESDTPWAKDVEQCYLRNTHNVPKSSLEKMLNRFAPHDEIVKRVASYVRTI